MHCIKFQLLVSVGIVLAQVDIGTTNPSPTIRPSYSCDPNQCKLPNCFCAGSKIPGNLDAKSIPQFMTLTFDDAVNSVLWKTILDSTSNHANPNGCPLSATFFVSTQYTDFHSVQTLHSLGHEIGCHTMNHASQPNQTEINGCRAALNAFAGIPNDKLLGFRFPFLNFTTPTFRNLQMAGGFTYDSSMTMDPRANLWPHTLDFGAAASCFPGSCVAPFSFPGLWEIPLYSLLNEDGTLNAAMDPNPVGSITTERSLAILKSNFLRNYNGNRTPMGVYLHAAFVDAVAIKQFIDWTQENYPDVYWVNNQQLISWIKNPTNIENSKTNPALDCVMPASDSSNVEVCDGIDNNGDGTVDAGLVSNCAFPETGDYFSTCFGCPPAGPSVFNPAPIGSSTKPRIGNSCPNNGVFDPNIGVCVNLKRTRKLTPTFKTSSGAAPVDSKNEDKKSSGSSTGSSLLFTFAVVATLMFIFK